MTATQKGSPCRARPAGRYLEDPFTAGGGFRV